MRFSESVDKTTPESIIKLPGQEKVDGRIFFGNLSDPCNTLLIEILIKLQGSLSTRTATKSVGQIGPKLPL